LLHLGCF
jgi:hypothetical protein